jgi:hypothetical protein
LPVQLRQHTVVRATPVGLRSATIDNGDAGADTAGSSAAFAPKSKWKATVRRFAIAAWRFVPLLVTAVILAVVLGAAWGSRRFVSWPLSGGCKPHLDLQFAGSATCSGASVDDLRWSLLVDSLVAVAYAGALYFILRKATRPSHLDARLQKVAGWAPLAAMAALAAGVIGNAILWFSVGHETSKLYLDGSIRADLVFGFAVVKWLALFFAIGQLVWHGVNWATQRTAPGNDVTQPYEFTPSQFGVCLSGGGIRSAGFSLGAMREFEHDGFLDSVGALAAVSGGNYVATGWMIGRKSNVTDSGSHVTDRMINHLLRDRGNPLVAAPTAAGDPAPRLDIGGIDLAVPEGEPARMPPVSDKRVRSLAGRHRFLFNGPGRLGRAIVHGLLAIVSNLVQIAAVVVAVGWPLGWFLDRHVYDWLAPVLGDRPGAQPDLRWAPGLYLVALGVLVVAITPLIPAFNRKAGIRGKLCSVTRWMAAKSFAFGVGIVAAGTAVIALTAAGPWMLVAVYSIGGGPSVLPIGAATLLALGGTVARLISNPVRTNASRLGGILLVLGLLGFLGKVVHDSASGSGFYRHWQVWVGALAIVCLAGLVLDTQAMSIRELYRARLTNSFVYDEELRPTHLRTRIWRWLRHRIGWPVKEKPPPHTFGLPWSALDTYPELVVCCAASRVGLATNGMPAESFTISQHQVAHHRPGGVVAVPTGDYLRHLRAFSLERFQSPAGWMSTSGAAFASAMGRSSLGTTNALLAAVNVDLGVWLPSPRQVQHRIRQRSTPGRPEYPFTPVRLGHLMNEILGFYAPEDDHVFVADGGHVENLGLIELLRRSVTTIVCVDASRDQPGSFSTLKSAIALTDTELAKFETAGELVVRNERRLHFDLTEIDDQPDPPETSVYRIPFCPFGDRCDRPISFEGHIKKPGHGQIYYAKLQRSLDQPLNLRLFAHTDPGFPNYSTGNQLLDDQEFIALLFAGQHAGRQVLARMKHDGVLSTWPPPKATPTR